MAKFKQNNVELRDDQKLIFDSAKAKYMSYDGSEVYVNVTVSGVDPTEDYHLVTKSYSDTEDAVLDTKIDTTSGTLQTQIDGLGGVFGNSYTYASSDGVSSTNSATPQQKLRLTTGDLTSGNYHIQWSFEWSVDDYKTGQFNAQVQIDDTTTIASTPSSAVPTDTADGVYMPGGGLYNGALSGVTNIDLDYWDAGSDGVNIRRARIAVWRTS